MPHALNQVSSKSSFACAQLTLKGNVEVRAWILSEEPAYAGSKIPRKGGGVRFLPTMLLNRCLCFTHYASLFNY
jgi:hypothetical protein